MRSQVYRLMLPVEVDPERRLRLAMGLPLPTEITYDGTPESLAILRSRDAMARAYR